VCTDNHGGRMKTQARRLPQRRVPDAAWVTGSYNPRMPKRARERTWRVYRLTGKGMVELGNVEARDEEQAIAKAVQEFDVPPALRNRVVVKQEP
jgi:hypothetical protein